MFLISFSNRVGLQNSNIVQFFSMLKKDDKSQQVVYYQVSTIWFSFI